MSVQYVSVGKVLTYRVTRIIRETLTRCLILLMEMFEKNLEFTTLMSEGGGINTINKIELVSKRLHKREF